MVVSILPGKTFLSDLTDAILKLDIFFNVLTTTAISQELHGKQQLRCFSLFC